MDVFFFISEGRAGKPKTIMQIRDAALVTSARLAPRIVNQGADGNSASEVSDGRVREEGDEEDREDEESRVMPKDGDGIRRTS